MVHEKKKVVKIVEELTLYFFALGADRIQSGIEKKGKSVVITFRANYHPDYARGNEPAAVGRYDD